MADIFIFFQIHIMLFYGLLAILGLCIGSLLNVIIYRLPRMLKDAWRNECYLFLNLIEQPRVSQFNLFKPRSFCPHCKYQIPFYRNIPLFSFLIQHGCCAHCKAPIAWQYPLVELLGCLLAVITGIQFGFSLQTLSALAFVWITLALMFIDINEQLLPDGLTFILLWLGLLINLYHLFIPIEQALWGAIVGYGSLWLVAKTFKLLRKQEGMGHGDFKLNAALGAWLGLNHLIAIILIASLLGVVVTLLMLMLRKHRYQQAFAFGPYLIIAGWLMLFWGDNITSWYQQWFMSL